jgi:hypothetical protein
MIGLTRNDYEPDLVYFSKDKVDVFTDDQMIFPAPNFVVEILSKKTATRDEGIKKKIMKRIAFKNIGLLTLYANILNNTYFFFPAISSTRRPKFFALMTKSKVRPSRAL